MTNSIQKFQFQKSKQEIRTTKKDGEIFFCLKDVCNALGLNNSSQVFSRIDPESGRYFKMTHPQSQSKMLNYAFVDEAGLYEVIFMSKKEEARNFKKWVTKDVLPTIRKTGSFQMPSFKELEDLTRRDVQIENVKKANAFHFALNRSKWEVANYNRKNCKQVVGKEPKEVRDEGRAAGLKSVITKSAREVCRAMEKIQIKSLCNGNERLTHIRWKVKIRAIKST